MSDQQQAVQYLAEALDNVISAVQLQNETLKDLHHVVEVQQQRLDRIDPDGVGV